DVKIPPPTGVYTLSLHDALPIFVIDDLEAYVGLSEKVNSEVLFTVTDIEDPGRLADVIASYIHLKLEDNQKILETFDFYERLLRSEEHTSELQSRFDLVCRLLLE